MGIRQKVAFYFSSMQNKTGRLGALAQPDVVVETGTPAPERPRSARTTTWSAPRDPPGNPSHNKSNQVQLIRRSQGLLSHNCQPKSPPFGPLLMRGSLPCSHQQLLSPRSSLPCPLPSPAAGGVAVPAACSPGTDSARASRTACCRAASPCWSRTAWKETFEGFLDYQSFTVRVAEQDIPRLIDILRVRPQAPPTGGTLTAGLSLQASPLHASPTVGSPQLQVPPLQVPSLQGSPLLEAPRWTVCITVLCNTV